jgi:hypothetical protein
VESPLPGDRHGGFGERPGETDREQPRHRAPGRLNHEADPHLSTAAASAAVDARLANRAVLDSPRQFTFLLTEGGLGWALVPGAAMAEQLEHIADRSRRENVRLGVIPWGRPVPEIPLNSWTEYDDQLVIVGTMTRVAYLTVRADLDAYRRLFDYFSGFAAFGDEARTIVQTAARRYRRVKDGAGS